MEKIMKNKKIMKFICVILMVIYIIGICPINIQNDIFFDIKIGENYIKNGIELVDDFSIHENLRYVSHHFLVNIITYLTYTFCGLKGIYVLEILLALVLANLFYKANKIYVKNSIFSYILVFFEIFFMIGFISQRAQMYSYLLFLLEIITLEKFLRTSNKKYLLILSIIPLLIVNFHAGVLPFYFIIIFVYLLNYLDIKFSKFENEKIFKKNLKYLFIPIILGFMFMFLNPFGVDGVVYSFKTISNDFINKNIMEFQPSNIINNTWLYIYLGIFIFSYIISNEKIKSHQIILLIGTFFMSLISVRHFSLLVIVSVTSMNVLEEIMKHLYNYLKKGIDISKEVKYKNTLIICYIFLILYLACGNFINMDKSFIPKSFYPNGGVEYIKNNIGKEKRIFNEYAWGSLLMLNNIKVFIDSRCDLYTEEYNKGVTVANDYSDALDCKKDYMPIFEKYNIDYVFIKKESHLNEFLQNDIEFTSIYSDDISVIYEIKKD